MTPDTWTAMAVLTIPVWIGIGLGIYFAGRRAAPAIELKHHMAAVAARKRRR